MERKPQPPSSNLKHLDFKPAQNALCISIAEMPPEVPAALRNANFKHHFEVEAQGIFSGSIKIFLKNGYDIGKLMKVVRKTHAKWDGCWRPKHRATTVAQATARGV